MRDGLKNPPESTDDSLTCNAKALGKKQSVFVNTSVLLLNPNEKQYKRAGTIKYRFH